MQFGITVGFQLPPEETEPHLRLREMLELVRMADGLGFDAIWVNHHFLATLRILQPLHLLARIAGETERMLLGTHVLVLPLYNPVDLAESVATLDVISGGRVVLGVGLGYREVEFNAFGMELRSRVRRFRESLQVIRAMWTQHPVSFEGEFISLKEVPSHNHPVQKPHPPIWIGAFQDPAIRRAAALGDGWMAWGNMYGPDALKEKVALYQEELRRLGRSLDRTMTLSMETCIRSTPEEALAVAEPYLRKKYAAYSSWGHMQESKVEELLANMMVGTADQCCERLAAVEKLGFSHILFRVHWLGMPIQEAMETVRRLGEEVIPRFRSRQG